MRIIGGRDYYDGCQSLGQDDLIFFRDRIAPTTEHAPIPFDIDDMSFMSDGRRITLSLSSPSLGEPVRRYTARFHDFEVRTLVVFFCGRAFVGVKIQRAGETEPAHLWDVAQVEAYLTKTFGKGFQLVRQRGIGLGRQAQFDEIATHMLIERRASLMVFTSENRWDRRQSCRIDAACLGDIGFARLLDPFSAYQELTMWVGNLGQAERDMVVISDVEKVRKHGFDKWSFRKMPGD